MGKKKQGDDSLSERTLYNPKKPNENNLHINIPNSIGIIRIFLLVKLQIENFVSVNPLKILFWN